MGKKGKPFKHGRHACIFCGGHPTTKEHIWPDWLKRHVPRRSKGMKHVGTFRRPGIPIEVRTTLRQGDPRAHKLPVTCAKCNSGWINHIDDAVKDIILGLAAGNWAQFDETTGRILAAWATRFVMVYEYAHPPTIVATAPERDYFMRTREPPSGWAVFLGYYDGTTWREAWNHRAASTEGSPGVAPKPNVQSTILVLGHMALNVVSGPALGDPAEYAKAFGMGVIWPLNFPTFFQPTSLDDDAIEAIATHFGGGKVHK